MFTLLHVSSTIPGIHLNIDCRERGCKDNREFAQLLDAGDCLDLSGEGSRTKVNFEKMFSLKTLSDRFMGMRAALLTDTPSLTSFGGEVGFSVLQSRELFDRNDASAQLSYDVVAFDLLKLLGFQEGKILEPSQIRLDLSLLFPRQSYTVKGSTARTDVRPYCPILMAQWQSGVSVTRKDTVKNFLFQDFKEHCRNLTVPANRFLKLTRYNL
ncbi:hypothetical protein POM88_028762 [Heracleum sosnowskyi]|uniref:Uncharacterized protein n=1 Tax=Heracleum sosnowskyi TaxID=360622 RepID=A0AAD8HTS2_9APIA|nr:hypothetical protein POM88_028762 [Heracleum sosnowskyi]